MAESALETRGNLFLNDGRYGGKRQMGYMPSCFVICPLPIRSKDKEVKEYVKEYNNFRMEIYGSRGIPGGKIARDLLMLFTTEAVYRNYYKDERVRLYFKNLSEFQRAIGMTTLVNGHRVIEVLERYSGCSVSFQMGMKRKYDGQSLLFEDGVFRGLKGVTEKGSTMVYKKIKNVFFIHELERIDLIKEHQKRGEPVSIDITLTSEFVDMVKDNAVPVDFTVYKEIQGAMMQDLYVWLVYRNYSFKNAKEKEAYIPKKRLVEQFGTEGGTNDNMKYSRILELLSMIKKNYYEDLNYEIVNNGKRREKGIILHKSPVVIQEKDVRYVPLLTSV